MIVIISSDSDQSTCDVINWLKYYNEDYILITENDKLEIIEIYPSGNYKFKVFDKVFEYFDIKSVWYRRDRLNLKTELINNFSEDNDISNMFKTHSLFEKNVITDFINYLFLRKKNINNYLLSSVNKLLVLAKAESVGLKIPDTLVTGCKKQLLEFKRAHKSLITKCLAEGAYFGNNDYWFYAYTEPVTIEMIDKLNDQFCPSLFQKQIPKKYEIRTFYLNNRFNSMSIFSQTNRKTKDDFRHYDQTLPNRNVGFKLPFTIENKLAKLMKSLNLNSGSIDLIYGKDHEFYFLEVNPIGQFGMLSYPCNYFLDKQIADFLL